MGEKKDRQFGSFLSGSITRHMAGDTEPPSTGPELDPESIRRAAERAFLPAKVKRLEAEIEKLKNEKGAKKRLRCRSHSELVDYVAKVKRLHPEKASEQAWIARMVDRIMDKDGKQLKDICPKRWMEVLNPPLGLAAALKHPILKSRVKTKISRAH